MWELGNFFYHQTSSFLIISAALSPLGNEAKKIFCNLRKGCIFSPVDLGFFATILMTKIRQWKKGKVSSFGDNMSSSKVSLPFFPFLVVKSNGVLSIGNLIFQAWKMHYFPPFTLEEKWAFYWDLPNGADRSICVWKWHLQSVKGKLFYKNL